MGVAADIPIVNCAVSVGLLHAVGQSVRLSSHIPEVDNLDAVVSDAVDDLVDAVHDKASEPLGTVLQQRLQRAEVGGGSEQYSCLTHLLQELVFALSAELAIDVPSGLADSLSCRC